MYSYSIPCKGYTLVPMLPSKHQETALDSGRLRAWDEAVEIENSVLHYLPSGIRELRCLYPYLVLR